MSNHLAIATVTATLRTMLQESVNADIDGAQVTTVEPHGTEGLPDLGVNIYLYQVMPNAAWRNADLPTRGAAGQVVQRPTIALDLHYLLTFYGKDGNMEPQRLQGSVVRAVHARPVLTKAMIEATLNAARLEDPNHYLLESDLASEVERVKFTPLPLSLEELSKLWSVLLQTTYRLSMAYLGTVVLIEAAETPRRPLPVRERIIGVEPFQRAIIDAVEADDGVSGAVEMGDTIVLRGRGLSGTVDAIRIGVAELPPVSGSLTPSEVRVALTDPSLRAGIAGVQILYHGGATSNAVPTVLRPRIEQDSGGNYRITHHPADDTIEVVVSPEVDPEQRVELLLNEFRPATGPGLAYRIDAAGRTAVSDTLTFPVDTVSPGTYLVRVQVGGAESTLDIELDEMSPNYGYYHEPSITIP